MNERVFYVPSFPSPPPPSPFPPPPVRGGPCPAEALPCRVLPPPLSISFRWQQDFDKTREGPLTFFFPSLFPLVERENGEQRTGHPTVRFARGLPFPFSPSLPFWAAKRGRMARQTRRHEMPFRTNALSFPLFSFPSPAWTCGSSAAARTQHPLLFPFPFLFLLPPGAMRKDAPYRYRSRSPSLPPSPSFSAPPTSRAGPGNGAVAVRVLFPFSKAAPRFGRIKTRYGFRFLELPFPFSSFSASAVGLLRPLQRRWVHRVHRRPSCPLFFPFLFPPFCLSPTAQYRPIERRSSRRAPAGSSLFSTGGVQVQIPALR